MKDINLENALENGTVVDANGASRGGKSTVSLSIVNSEDNGKRITFSKGFLNNLENPKEIQFVISNEYNCLIIGENLKPDGKKYRFSKEGGRTLYCSGAIQEIVLAFKLDYSNGKTSLSFNDVAFKKFENGIVAVVNMA